MCGFLGEFSLYNERLSTSKVFLDLLELSKHRGPDSTEIISKDNFQLGFNRLAILDVSANGNQPKQSPSKRYTVVFNGEIYNYKALQKEYDLKDLRSTSDTEVLIHLLDKCGVEKTINILNGMYAIAIMDNISNSVFLARDFAGIKPLFYGISQNGIVFASQFDQVFKHTWHCNDLKLRPEIMKEYFGFGFMHAPNTVYKNIFQVKPGELIEYSHKGQLIKKSLLEFSKAISKNKKEKVETAYNSVLEKAVSKQLASDMPLASFLSGGIDSPLITAVAKATKKDIEAFTFGIDNEKYDESIKARAYAQHLKIKHTLEKGEESDIINHIETHFKYFSEPFGDYSSIPTYVLTKRARKSHTVMLSGDGGDELFFGYPRMLDVLNKKHWFLIPFFIRKPLVAILNKLNIISTWAPYSYKTLAEWIKAKQMYILPNVLNAFFDKGSFSNEVNDLFNLTNINSKQNLLHWLRWNEFYGHMQRVLIKVDRASMANSLEVRVPFLDKESIEYAWDNIPLLLNDNVELKKVLKENLTIYYPKKIIQTQKKGFSVPIENWLRNELKENVEDYIFRKPFYGESNINVSKVKNFVTDFYDKKHNNGWGVWHIYAWQKWAYNHVIKGNSND